MNAISPIELGQYLARAREHAKLSQADLARKITMSQAVLSRAETGERSLTSEELDAVLAAINTPDATKLRVTLERKWASVSRPRLGHPDQELLWEAETAIAELENLGKQADIKGPFSQRLREYIAELQAKAALLLKESHQIAFVGNIGIGKSTAICRLAELEVPSPSAGAPLPVLETGAGGTTICEVHLCTGPDYGLRIERRSDEEIRADVADFAENIRTSASKKSPQDSDSQGISKEIERAIRNMSGLTAPRIKGADGKSTRNDKALELFEATGRVERDFLVEVLARMELHRRDKSDIWYDKSTGKQPLEWIKSAFEDINNGRHKDFPIPKRIEVIVPHLILKGYDADIRIIDTKGVDRTVARADLEGLLEEPHTLAVLCSGFNDAPGTTARTLLERANSIGNRTIATNASILVFPRDAEASEVKDGASGIRVETTQEGYELKKDDVEMSLSPLGMRHIPIGFYNARQDNIDELRRFLRECITSLRAQFQERLRTSIQNAKRLQENYKDEQAMDILRHAAGTLHTWAQKYRIIPSGSTHIHDDLMKQLELAHASSIHASMRRGGEWPSLSYSHLIGHGARCIAAETLSKNIDGFKMLCGTLEEQYPDAAPLLQQARQVLEASYEEILRKIQIMGQESFLPKLKVASSLWADCINEWGAGQGYRFRVIGHNKHWFSDAEKKQLEHELQTLIQREWTGALERMTSLLDVA